MHCFRFAAFLLFALLLIGCSQKEPPRGVVKGRVTMGSKGVSGATVFFENAEAGVAMNAPLDADGNYEVKSYKGDGLTVGSYKVAILPGGVMTADEQGPKAHEAKSKRPKPSVEIPEKYHKTATSAFTIDVKEGDNPPFNFDLVP